jgi:hypothetical protein
MDAPYRLRAPRPASATTDVLGPLVRTYYASSHNRSIVSIVPFGIGLAYILWLAHEGQLLHWFNSMFSAVPVGILLVLSIALITTTSAVGGGELVRVHANGILDLRMGPKAVRWDEIESLTTVWNPQGSGVLRHVLRTSDGAQLSLGKSIAGVDNLVDEVRARMIDHAVPALRARIADGGEARFGVLSADDRGVALGDDRFAWADVRDIEAEDDGHVVLRGASGKRLASARLDDVPNAFLLAELAHERRRG